MDVKKIGKIAVFSPAIFIAIVVYLHSVQTDYEPAHQFMSELALGPMGWLMLFAFCSLGGSVGALAIGLLLSGARSAITVLLLLGTTGFIGAGFVRLDENANVHIGLVAVSFVTVALSMYLLPSSSDLFKGKRQKAISWILAIGLGVSVALGSSIIPAGVGQRISSLLLIFWLVWAGFRLSKLGVQRNA